MNEKVEPEEIREIIPKEYYAIASPKILIENALERANILASVIRDRKLYVSIQGREFVQVEGWTLLGQMCGIYPVLVFTRQEGEGYVSYVELRTRGGEVVGAAQGYCGRDEKQWQNKPAHQLISMSQTRATSKALRISLGYIMRLAGYEPTPAEEVESEERFSSHSQEQAQSNSHPPVQQAEGSEVNYHRGAFGIFHKLGIATSAEQPLRKRIYRTLFGKEANLTNEEWKQVFEFVKDIESKEDLISELDKKRETSPSISVSNLRSFSLTNPSR